MQNWNKFDELSLTIDFISQKIIMKSHSVLTVSQWLFFTKYVLRNVSVHPLSLKYSWKYQGHVASNSYSLREKIHVMVCNDSS